MKTIAEKIFEDGLSKLSINECEHTEKYGLYEVAYSEFMSGRWVPFNMREPEYAGRDFIAEEYGIAI